MLKFLGKHFLKFILCLTFLSSCMEVKKSYINVERFSVLRSLTSLTLSCPNSAPQNNNYSCLPTLNENSPESLTWTLGAATTCNWISLDPSTGKVSGTPDDEQVGPCNIEVQVADDKTSLIKNFPFTVTNVQPSLSIAGSSLSEDSPLTVIRTDAQVQATDEGHGVYFLDNAAATAPKCSNNGVVSVDANTGAISYTPALNYNGTCNVLVSFDDQNPLNNIGSYEFAVTVTPVNDPPTISSTCSTTVNEDAAYNCAATVSDVDTGDTYTWSLDASNTCAWASINSSGVISGSPNDDQVGSCTLAFKTNDGIVDSNINSYTITVTNVQPTLSISNTGMSEDGGLTSIRIDADVQASDETFGVYSLDNATTTAPKCSANGVVSIDANTGAIDYNPALNYNGICNIKVIFDDQNAINNTVATEFSVTVSPVNDTPSVSSSCSLTINEDAAYNCAATVTDIDAGDTHTWSLDPTNTCVWASINASGVISGTPNDDQVGTCVLAFKANDGTVDSNVNSYIVSISNVQPTLTISNTSLAEDSGLTAIRLDADVQASDETFGLYSLDNATATAPKCSDNGVVSIDANTGAIYYSPALNYNGTCNIKVIFDDQNSVNNTVASELAVTVTPVNDPPTITKSCKPASQICGGDRVGIMDNVTGAIEYFSGIHDMSNRMTCFVPSGTGYDIFVAASPSFPRVSTATHTVIALGDDQVSNQTLAVNVPFFGTGVGNLYVASNGYLGITNFNDYSSTAAEFNARKLIAPFWTDLNPNDGGTIYVKEEADRFIATWDQVAEFGSSGLTLNSAQIEIFNTTGEIVVTTGQLDSGTFYYGLSNGGGASNTIDFNGGAFLPNNVMVAEDSAYSCTLIASDLENDPLTWSISASNTCAWLSINPTSGALSGTPIDDQVGSCIGAVQVSDGALSSAEDLTNYNVTNVTPLLAIADTSILEDSAATVIRLDADVQSSDETWGVYSLLNATTSGTKCSDNGTIAIDSATGAVTYTPATNFTGTCNIKVQFDDQNSTGNLVSDEFIVTVTNVNDPPVVASSCSLTGTESVAYTCTPGLTDPDPADTHTWSLTAANTCAWASINASTGVISGTPNDDQVGNCTIAYKTNDGTVDSNVDSFSVTIANAVPTLTIANTSLYQDSPATVIRADADVQSNNEGYGVYSLLNATTSGVRCVDHGTLSIDTATGAITFTPAALYIGDCNVKVQFDDQNAVNNLVATEFTVTVMDNAGPVVTKVDSAAGDKTYYYGETVAIDVHFSEPTFVDTTGGTPKIKLETGIVDKYAYYSSGSGTNIITFNYIVGNADISSDLDVHAVGTSIELSGGTIRDNFANDATLALKVGVDPNSLATLRNIVIDAVIDFAEFSGQPTRVSAAIILNIDVFGPNIVAYKYKVEPTSTVDCSVATGYSVETVVATNITDNISATSNGTSLTLCLLGKNSIGNWQPYDMPTTYVWTKDKYAITVLDFSGITNIPSFKEAAVAPNNDSVIYAQNLKGEILRTIDAGTTWTLMCKLPTNLANDTDSKIQVAASDDYTAYVSVNNDVYRVDNLLGSTCLNMTSAIDQVYTGYIVSGLTLHPSKSELYIWAKDTTGSTLMKSTDRGETWSTIINHTAYDGEFGTLAINPLDDQIMAAYRWSGANTLYGFYYSSNGGASWVYDPFEKPSTESYARGLLWNPVDANNLYMVEELANSSVYYSTDQGHRWTSTGALPWNRRWTFDGSGNGYYLIQQGFDTLLKKASPFLAGSSASFTTAYTFLNMRGINTESQSISVSNSGATMAAIIENNLLISTDSGTTFTEVNWLGTKDARLDSVSSEDGGQSIYGVTPNWSVVKSLDGGQNWTYQYSYHNHCAKNPRIRVSQANSDHSMVWADSKPTSTNCNNLLYSSDGFANGSFSNNAISANDVLVAMSPVDQDRFFAIGDNNKYRGSKDGGISWTEDNSLWSTSTSFIPESYSHPEIADLVWVGQTNGAGSLWEYDTQNNARTDITSRLPQSSFAGLNVTRSSSGQFMLRTISRTGDLSFSTDNGLNFTSEGMATPLSSCTSRFLSTHPKDPNLISSACQNGNNVSFSRDGGSSWIEMNLFSLYGINCAIRGIAIHLSKIIISCKNSESLLLNYTPLELVNDVYDGILSSFEAGNTNDLIVNVNAAGFVNIEYAVIPAATTCNQLVPNFSPTIPKTNDPNMAADGDYKVCAKMTDSLAVDFYETSSTFTKDTVAPNFVSIDLLGLAADGALQYYEHYKNINPLVGNINASGFDTSLYAVVPNATTCDNTLNYVQSIPAHNSELLTSAGTYKVCVKLTDYAGHPPAYGASPSFTFSPIYAYSLLSGEPDRVTRDLNLNISVSGTIVTKYKYKLGDYASTVCTDSAGYGAEVPVATNITDDLSIYATNTHLKICVLGSNASNDWQPYQFATEREFTYSDKNIKYINTGAVKVSNWHDVAVSPTNSAIIYAESDDEKIYKSTDTGATWELQCELNKALKSSFDPTTNLFVSNGPDGTAYITTESDLYRIDRLHGDQCLNLTSGFSSLHNYGYTTRSATTDSSGNLFFWEEKTGIGATLWKSTNQGDRFDIVKVHTDSAEYYARMDIDPSNPNNMMLLRGNSSTGRGAYKSIDGGNTWTYKYTVYNNNTKMVHYLPGNSQYLFINGGYYSSDGGENWTSGGSSNYFGYDRFELDGIKGYRFRQNGANFELQMANDMTTLPPTWNGIKTFSYGLSHNFGKSISANGNVIAVVVDSKLNISTDSGTTWTEIDNQNSKQLVHGVDSFREGEVIYGAIQGHRLIKSLDQGDTWTFKAALLTYENSSNSSDRDNPMVNIDPNNKNNIAHYTHDPVSSTSINDGLSTMDDFATLSTSTSFSSNYNSYAFDPVHEGIFTNYNPSSTFKSFSNFGESYSSHAIKGMPSYSSSYYLLSNAVLPSKSDASIVFLNNERAYKILASHESSTNITSLLTAQISSFAGTEVFKDSDGHYKIRVISDDGKMVTSNDNGQTWAQVGNLTPSLPTCNKRKVRTSQLDPNYIVTYCPGSDSFSLTKDAGMTWTTDNLATYSLDCSIGQIAMTSTRLLIGCANDYGLIYKLNSIKFETPLNDNVLNSTELAAASNLVSPDLSSAFSTNISYSLVTAGTTCDAALTYTASIPQSNSPDIVGDGDYKICLMVTDNNAGVSYESSKPFRVDTTAPTFTSIALSGIAADGNIEYHEKTDDPDPIVSNLVGANYDFAKYIVVDSAITCNNALTYSKAIPSGSNSLMATSGTYKVCVELSDQAGNTPAYGASNSFTVNATQIFASIGNLPEMITNAAALDITVGGINVTHYKYKVGDTTTINCADSSGYSAEIPVATNITNSLTGYAINTTVKVCVLGTNGAGTEQALLEATSHSFLKHNYRLGYYNFNGLTYTTGWSDVEVAPNDQTIIYAKDYNGAIFKSIDSGANWTEMCSVGGATTTQIKVAPDGSKAYTNDENYVYFVYENFGGQCKKLKEYWGTHTKANYDVYPNGDLLLLDIPYINGSKQYYFYKYTNNTANLQVINALDSTQSGGNYNPGFIAIDPINPNNILWNNPYNTSWGWQGISRTTDAGASWNLFTTLTNSDAYTYDPVNPDMVYSNNGKYSTDGGLTFTTAAGYVTAYDQWHMDSTGAAYHLKDVGSDTVLERSPDMLTPAWANLYTFPGIIDTNKNVSASGNTITVIIGSRFFLSTDAGATFNEIINNTNQVQISTIDRIGNTIYAASPKWEFFKSVDNGVTWTDLGLATTPEVVPPILRVAPSNSNQVSVYAPKSSDYNTKTIFTHDGFSTFAEGNQSISGYWVPMAISPTDANRIYFLGNSKSRYSTDGGDTFTETTSNVPNVWFTSFFSYISPLDNNLVHSAGSNVFYEYDQTTQTQTNVESRLTFADTAGMEVYLDGATWKTRVISRYGILNNSTDGSQSFSLEGNAIGTLSYCSKRQLKTLDTNPNVMVTTCQDSSSGAYSTDGGNNWTQFSISSSLPIPGSCLIHDFELVEAGIDKKVIFSCSGLKSLVLTF